MNKGIKLVVLYGGVSSEHIISVSSAETIIKHLNPDRYVIKPVYISKIGDWICADNYCLLKNETEKIEKFFDTSRNLATDKEKIANINYPIGIENMLADKPDVVFIIMHGVNGEDGSIQGLLEYFGLRYTGSGILSSALCMDKIYSKQIYKLNNIPTPPFVQINRKEWKDNKDVLIKRIIEEIGLPAVIKIPGEGSSIGMDICKDERSISTAMDELFSKAPILMIEEFIDGIEVTCGVLKESEESECIAFPLTEIVPKSSQYFDYYSKYTPGASDEITPARVSEKIIKEVQAYSIVAHKALGCGSMSRSDMIIRDDIPYFLETNTIPGMTPTSLYPQGARAYGISFTDLLDRIIDYSL